MNISTIKKTVIILLTLVQQLKKKLTFFIISLLILNISINAEETSSPSAALFFLKSRSIQMNALGLRCVTTIHDSLHRLGRFLPVEVNQQNSAIDRAMKENSKNVFKRTAQLVNAEIYIVIHLRRRGNMFLAEARIYTLKDTYRSLQKIITIKSNIIGNVPMKLTREIAALHKIIPVITKAIKTKNSQKMYSINAGQWHGLKNGTYNTNLGKVKIIQTKRYNSYIVSQKHINNKTLVFKKFPKVQKEVDRITTLIKETTYNRYKIDNILKGANPEKRFLEGLLLINTGANFCLPGYGAFLSTKYLGFTKLKPDYLTMSLSGLIFIHHFLLPMYYGGFTLNFFPGVNDADKSSTERNLQYFTWITFPITLSVAFLDQLAIQFQESKILPPFFYQADLTASVLSLFIPGAGLFYKGHRIWGWTYYITEMALLGTAVTLLEHEAAPYIFIAFGVIKVIDILHAALTKSSYNFYNKEMDKGDVKYNLYFGFRAPLPGQKDDLLYAAGLTYRY